MFILNNTYAIQSNSPHDTKLQFVENNGQWEDFIKYQADIGIGQLFLENSKITFSLIDPEYIEQRHDHSHNNDNNNDTNDINQTVQCHAYSINFLNSLGNVELSGKQMYSTYRNYYIGNDQSKWASNVRQYKEVAYNRIYDGISFRIYGVNENLKYDFIIDPLANPNRIKLEYDGVDDIFIKDEKLHVITSVNTIIEQEPYAYQIINGRKMEVKCKYVLDNNTIHFDFPNGYDKTIELIIDPTLVFSSFSGSTKDNWGFSATFDNEGNLYGAGIALKETDNYPTTTGAFQEVYGGGRTDIAISKFSVDGASMLYSTYIGGNSTELPHSLIVNSVGQLVILGSTSSSDFPTTSNAYDNTFNGGSSKTTTSGLYFPNGSDIIVCILNADGTNLIGSTFVGGSKNDGVNFDAKWMNYGDDSRGEVFVDEHNHIYIGTTTYSEDFPTSPGAYMSSFGGGDKDGCIFKMSFDASSMLWSTYLGGSQNDAIFSLKIHEDNSIYATGFTKSHDFPTSFNALNTNYMGGNSDGFITRISPDGTTVLSSTYLGTSNTDKSYFLDFDADGNAIVIGQSDGGQYPISGNVFSKAHSGLFIHKLDPKLQFTYFSTVIGNGDGNREISPAAFMVDQCNRIFFSGWGGLVNFGSNSMSGMPITSDAIQSTTDGEDFYFGVLAEDANQLIYGTYFGGKTSRGEHVDGGTSRFDKRGTIYQAVCAGCGGSDDFPTTPGAYSNSNNSSNCNLGVIKFDFEQPIVTADAQASPSYSGCIPETINFSNYSEGATEYLWDFGDNTTSTDFEPTHTYTEEGNFTVRLIVNGNAGYCNTSDTVYLPISIIKNDNSTHTEITMCDLDGVVLEPSHGIPGANYTWQDGSNNYSHIAKTPGIYWVKTSLDGCKSIDTFSVKVNEIVGHQYEINEACEGQPIELSPSKISDENTYLWVTGQTNKNITVSEEGTYWVRIYSDGCFFTDSIQVVYVSAFYDSLNYSICEGDSLYWQNEYFYSNTNTTKNYQSALGCDSTYTLDLKIKPNFIDTILTYICYNTTYTLPDGTVIDSAGFYENNFQTIYGCDSTLIHLISLLPQTSYLNIIKDSMLVSLGNSTEINVSTNINNQTIKWEPPTYLDCDDCINVTATPYQNIKYIVTATDENGCIISDSISLYVDNTRHVYIPNIITPDITDGNNVFQVFTDQGAKSILSLKVFDRWGSRVYSGVNLTPNVPGEGWDGIFLGEKVQPAVFVFIAEVLFLDGETAVYTGDLTVIR